MTTKLCFMIQKSIMISQPSEFSSGEGLVPEGFEVCDRLMLPGEIAIVTFPPDYAYDRFPRPPGVPEGAYIQWEIELLGFEMSKDWTGLTFRNIMDDAEYIRNTENRLFKEGKYELAKANYEKVLREFNHVNPQDDEEGKEFSNTRVIDANPAQAKALYRRGMAYMSLGDFEDARNDFEMMMKVDKLYEPDAAAALQKLKQKEQEVERTARRRFKGLFDKKPGEISDVGKEEDSNQNADKNLVNDGKEELPETEAEKPPESAVSPPQVGLLSRIQPTAQSVMKALVIQLIGYFIIKVGLFISNLAGRIYIKLRLASVFNIQQQKDPSIH